MLLNVGSAPGRLEVDALRICARFRLRYRVLEAERANVKRRYGVCYSDGTIRIRLRHATSGKPLKYSSLVNTLCHELAHLKHFNHGPRFQTLYAEILNWARREKVYQPRRLGTAVKPMDPLEVHPAARRPEVEVSSIPESTEAGRRNASPVAQLSLFE